MSKPRLEGKVAFITGATSGIGAVMARLFALEGAKVVLAARRRELGEAGVAEIRAAGGEADFQAMDVTREDQVEKALDGAVERFGTLDVLVNNAGPLDLLMSGTDGRVHELATAGFDQIVKTALYGPMWCCKYALPRMMQAGKGSIVNISSLSSVVGLPSLASYSSAKGGLCALTRQIAVDYGQYGIRCNGVIVGFIKHETTAAVVNTPEKEAAFRDRSLTRLGIPEDVAQAALYLASDESEFLTGTHITVDGGVQIKSR